MCHDEIDVHYPNGQTHLFKSTNLYSCEEIINKQHDSGMAHMMHLLVIDGLPYRRKRP